MRSRWMVGSIAVLCVVSVSACGTAESAEFSDANRAAIQSVTDSAVALLNAATPDFGTFVKQYYSTDAMVMPPNGPAVEGDTAIAAWFTSFPPLTDFRLRTLEVDGTDDLAYVRGRYSLKINPPGAPAIPDSGKFIEIWRKQANGSWRITDDIYNSDIPLPEPPPAPPPRR